MISSKDVRWVAEDNVPVISRHKIGTSTFSQHEKALKHPKSKPMPSHSIPEESRLETIDAKRPKSDHDGRSSITLKDLGEHDKQKVVQLIRELAKAGEEKENLIHAFCEERQKLIAQAQSLEGERLALRCKQDLLTEEVKRCNELLQHYQNLTFMQQASLQTQEPKPTPRTPSPEKAIRPLPESFHSPAASSLKMAEMKESKDSDFMDDDTQCTDMSQNKDFLWHELEKPKSEQGCRQKVALGGRNIDADNLITSNSSEGGEPDESLVHQPGHARLSSEKGFPVLLQSPRCAAKAVRKQPFGESPSGYVTSSSRWQRDKTENTVLESPSDVDLDYSCVSSQLNQPVATYETSLRMSAFDEHSAIQLSDEDSAILQDIFFVL